MALEPVSSALVSSALVKLGVYLFGKIKKEVSLAAAADDEYDDLVALKQLIEGFLEDADSEEVSDWKLKACTKKMKEFLSETQRTIDDFTRCESNHCSCRTFASKARDIRQKMARYLNNLETIHALENFRRLSSNHTPSSSVGYRSLPIPYYEETDGDLVGIKEPRDQLISWLTENDLMSKVIFVYGPPGVGKSSLVGSVLRCQNVKNHFKYYVWIKDLRSCESSNDMKTALMKANAKMWDLTKNDEQGKEVVLEEIFSHMREDNQRRWALVLDDASRANVFESLKMLLSETRLDVLVTTRINSLASSSKRYLDSRRAQSSYSPEPSKRWYDFLNLKLPVLSVDDSRKLFCRNMLSKDTCPPQFRDDYDSILLKCGGLPLAIHAMCEHLNHSKRGSHGPQKAKWTKWSDSFGNVPSFQSSTCDHHRSIRRMITQSEDHLHDVCPWVSYLSIFPLDCPIRCSTLMRLWMAERFPKEMRTNWYPAILEEALKELIDRNIFLEVKEISYGRVKTCRVNNLLHQIIISKSQNDKFAMIVDGKQKVWPDQINRLSFHSTVESEVVGKRVKRLSSLHVNKKACPQFLKNLLGQVEELEVLDLQRLFTKVENNCYQDSLKSFPDEIFRLKFLRYLSLRDNKVKKIPDGIGDLACLETLDLKGTCVSELPNRILKLTRLCHLLVYRPDRHLSAGTDRKHGFKAPLELGALKSLENLCMIELDPGKKGRRGGKNEKRRRLLNEIGKLTNLQRLGISMMRSTDVELLFSSIGKLTNLETLRLIAAPGQKIDLSKQDKRDVLKTLKRVHLTGCLETSPQGPLPFTSLVKLVLKGSQLNGDPLQHLGELLYLEHLELQQAFGASEVKFKKGQFEELRFFGLDTIDSLQFIQVEEEALPTLEILSLARCKSLTVVPPDIKVPRELKYLKLFGMPKEFMMAVKMNIPAHIQVQCQVWKQEAIEDALERLRAPKQR